MAVETGTYQVVMPAMGDSVVEGTVLEWHKQEGDSIETDETLVEISTDKVDAEVPAPVSGRIVKLYAAEGDTVGVGGALAEIATSDNGGGNGNGPAPAATAEPPAAEAAEVIDIVTPAGSESVTEGTILEWSVKVGDAVKDGDTIVEISTDKVDMELPAPAAGTITEILYQEGETVGVGQVIARMAVGAGAAAPESAAGGTGSAQTGTAENAVPAPDPGSPNATPVAQRVALRGWV